MKLTETELEVINYLRYLHVRMNKKYHNYSPVQNLSDKEVVSLYNKIDLIIVDEGSIKRSFGIYDEVYMIELNGVKSSLLHEIENRGIIMSEIGSDNINCTKCDFHTDCDYDTDTQEIFHA